MKSIKINGFILSLLIVLPLLMKSQEIHFIFADQRYTQRISIKVEFYVLSSDSIFKLVRLSDSTFLIPDFPPEAFNALRNKKEIEVKMILGNRCFITVFPNFIVNSHRSVHLYFYRGNKRRLGLNVSQGGKAFVPIALWCDEYTGQYKNGLVAPEKLFTE